MRILNPETWILNWRVYGEGKPESKELSWKNMSLTEEHSGEKGVLMLWHKWICLESKWNTDDTLKILSQRQRHTKD